MMTPNWTTERPSVPGDYWMSFPPYKRLCDRDKMRAIVVKDDGLSPPSDQLAVYEDGEWLGFLSDDWLDNAWWAPRDTPADPFLAQTTPTGKKYVILDSRQIVGNCALFWRPDGAGYTSDLNDAGLYDKTEGRRETDIYVPIEAARSMAVTHVRVEPLKRAGYWPKPPVIKRETQRCEGCSRFVKRGGWLCPKCHEKETRQSS